MKTPFLGGAYLSRSVNLNAQRCINLFPEMVETRDGKAIAAFYTAPGLDLWVTLPRGPVRGLLRFGSFLYAVGGDRMYRVDTGGGIRELGALLTGTGPVSMATNGIQVMAVDGDYGYIVTISSGAFSLITDPDFPGADTVGFLDGYFIFNEPDTGRFMITALYDGTAVSALDIATTEGAPDNVVAILPDHRELLVFGTDSVEPFYNSGNADFPFDRIGNGFIEEGCAAAFSPAKINNSVFWVGGDAKGRGIVWRADGYTPTQISTHAIETAMESYSTIADARGYVYQQAGHTFYVLTFPAGNATWVYDINTKLWHERSYRNPSTGEMGRHRGDCHCFFAGRHVVGDYENGNLYAFNLDTFTDNGDARRWIRSWRAIPEGQNTLVNTTLHRLQLDAEYGVGLNTGQGSDPQCMLRISEDGGHTWSSEIWEPLGAIGKYSARAVFEPLGSAVDPVFELSGSEPVKTTLIAAELSATPGQT